MLSTPASASTRTAPPVRAAAALTCASLAPVTVLSTETTTWLVTASVHQAVPGIFAERSSSAVARAELGRAPGDQLRGGTGGADLPGGGGVGDRDDHLAVGVGVGAGGTVTEAVGQAGGGVGRCGRGGGGLGGCAHQRAGDQGAGHGDGGDVAER